MRDVTSLPTTIHQLLSLATVAAVVPVTIPLAGFAVSASHWSVVATRQWSSVWGSASARHIGGTAVR